MIRIQFDIEEELWERFKRYSFYKQRHANTYQALIEWINRREARDKRLRREQLFSDIDQLKPIIKTIMEELHEETTGGPDE